MPAESCSELHYKKFSCYIPSGKPHSLPSDSCWLPLASCVSFPCNCLEGFLRGPTLTKTLPQWKRCLLWFFSLDLTSRGTGWVFNPTRAEPCGFSPTPALAFHSQADAAFRPPRDDSSDNEQSSQQDQPFCSPCSSSEISSRDINPWEQVQQFLMKVRGLLHSAECRCLQRGPMVTRWITMFLPYFTQST